MSQFSYDVFLSFAHQDIIFARQVVSWLRSAGFRVWFAEEQLVPGTRFRAGLQQGIKESNHMVALLTNAYRARPWTQRELDLFDLTAEHSERKLLAVELEKQISDELDQIFLVHQRIPWSGCRLDLEGLWKLYCGLIGQSPGPNVYWSSNAENLLDAADNDNRTIRNLTDYNSSAKSSSNSWNSKSMPTIGKLAIEILDERNLRWREPFDSLRNAVQSLGGSVFHEIITTPWSVGASEISSVMALALLPIHHSTYSVWPFVDFSCERIADWFLLAASFDEIESSEVWFSWAVCEQRWALLQRAAKRAPDGPLTEHFGLLAQAALSKRSFQDVEEEYDYGVMITPWNHLHLSWLAIRLGDFGSALAHATALCEATRLGDLRTGRYLNRLTTWEIFNELRSESKLAGSLKLARRELGLIDAETIPGIQRRLLGIWQYAKAIRDV